MSNSRIRIRLSKWDEYLASDGKTGAALEKRLQPIAEWNGFYHVDSLPPPNWLRTSMAAKKFISNELVTVTRRHGPPNPGTLDLVLVIDAVTPESVYELDYRQLTLTWAGVRLLSLTFDRFIARMRLIRQVKLSGVELYPLDNVWEMLPYDFIKC